MKNEKSIKQKKKKKKKNTEDLIKQEGTLFFNINLSFVDERQKQEQ